MNTELNIRAVASITPVGKKITDRRMDAVAQSTSLAARVLIAANGGKVGKAAAMLNVPDAIEQLAQAASTSDYRGLAEVISAANGKVITLDRYAFHALPGRFADEMANLTSMGKDFSATTGKASAAYSLACHMHGICTKVVTRSEEIRAERKAEQEAKNALSAPQADTTAAIIAELDRIDQEVAAEVL